MHRYRNRASIVAAVLLVAATILFVVGTSLERSGAKASGHQETSAVESTRGEAGEHGESEGESEEAAEGESTAAAEEAGQPERAGEPDERLLGINPESAGLTAGVAVLSLLLAAALVAWPRQVLLVAVVFVGLLFAALDVREGLQQASESNPGLLAIALGTGVLHLGAAVAAAIGVRSPRPMVMTR
jgi:hypothetical protein